ncbi:hypothetical protein [Prevotella denticola]|uniref:hypothetical protein n=1 Tax=Prevotella denticola TaxID=28129 RepID=UPI0028DC0B37|nr:hypothetical protein [Prevotella denticola]
MSQPIGKDVPKGREQDSRPVGKDVPDWSGICPGLGKCSKREAGGMANGPLADKKLERTHHSQSNIYKENQLERCL